MIVNTSTKGSWKTYEVSIKAMNLNVSSTEASKKECLDVLYVSTSICGLKRRHRSCGLTLYSDTKIVPRLRGKTGIIERKTSINIRIKNALSNW